MCSLYRLASIVNLVHWATLETCGQFPNTLEEKKQETSLSIRKYLLNQYKYLHMMRRVQNIHTGNKYKTIMYAIMELKAQLADDIKQDKLNKRVK